MTERNSHHERPQFANGYELVNGVAMHAENGDNFQIPPDVIKRNIRVGQFVELRIDSSRFSVHEDEAEQCHCPSCNGLMTKPILRHEHPVSLVAISEQDIPSRGWGEDFWVRVAYRDGQRFRGTIDNHLVESRLHELTFGIDIEFHQDHILAVHGSHRAELVHGMNLADRHELIDWLQSNQA